MRERLSAMALFAWPGTRVEVLGAAAEPAAQPFAVDAAGPRDGDVLEVLAPDQAVVPVAVAEVLIRVARSRLGGVVAASTARVGGEQHRALVEVEADVAPEADRVAGVGAAGDDDGAAAGGGGGSDRAVDRVAVDRHAVALGAEVAHVETAAHRRHRDDLRRRWRRGERRARVSRARRARAGDAGEQQRQRERPRMASSEWHARRQSRWNTSRSGRLRGLSSGLVGMMSRMYVHHRRHTSVWAMASQRASSSIST